jgi:hypothetical protein
LRKTDAITYEVHSNEVVEKISDIAESLTITKNENSLINGVYQLDILLSTYDPPVSSILQYIDSKGQDLSTYFMTAYFNTKDVGIGLWVYRMVRLLVRYVLLYDRFYEVGDKSYGLMAKQVLQKVNNLSIERRDKCISYSLNYALKRFWSFWAFEQLIKHTMLGGHTYSYKEIRHHNLSKSSDAPIIYARVLESELEDFSENVSLILHYNQALLDIEDDFDDIEDDIYDAMPNVFVMAATQDICYKKIRSKKKVYARDLVLCNSNSKEIIHRLVDEYYRSINAISLPDKFAFLKLLSNHYVDRLGRKLN